MIGYYPNSNGEPRGSNLDICKTNNSINNFYTNKSVYQHLHRDKHIHTQMNIHIYTHIQIYIYIKHIYIYIYIYIHASIHIHKCIHIYAYNIYTKHPHKTWQNRTYMETYMLCSYILRSDTTSENMPFAHEWLCHYGGQLKTVKSKAGMKIDRKR